MAVLFRTADSYLHEALPESIWTEKSVENVSFFGLCSASGDEHRRKKAIRSIDDFVRSGASYRGVRLPRVSVRRRRHGPEHRVINGLFRGFDHGKEERGHGALLSASTCCVSDLQPHESGSAVPWRMRWRSLRSRLRQNFQRVPSLTNALAASRFKFRTSTGASVAMIIMQDPSALSFGPRLTSLPQIVLAQLLADRGTGDREHSSEVRLN